MSVLIPATQPNKDSFYFALAGGTGANLQSPATIIPDGSGNTSLTVNATGNGNGVLNVVGGTAAGGIISLGNTAAIYRAGVVPQPTPLPPSLPSFTIGINSVSAPPAFTYDGGTGVIVLGDQSATGAIQTTNKLLVGDQSAVSIATNSVLVAPTTATNSEITNTCTSQGTLSLGSSLAFSDTLVVSDVTIPSPATANYVQVNGAAGQVPLVINGAQGSGGGCGIYPKSASGITSSLNLGASLLTTGAVKIQQTADVAFVDVGGNGGQNVRLRGVSAGASVQTGIISSDAGANGQLQFQGSSGSSNSVNLTDTTCTFDQQIVQQVPGATTYAAATVLADATYTSGTSANFNIGTFAPGLYMCMIRVNQANIADPDTLANIGSGLVYLQKSSLDPTQTVVVGGGTFGNGNVGITSIVTAGIGANVMRLVVNVGNVYVNVKMFQIMDVIPGMSS
jgi:hypothetical protein